VDHAKATISCKTSRTGSLSSRLNGSALFVQIALFAGGLTSNRIFSSLTGHWIFILGQALESSGAGCAGFLSSHIEFAGIAGGSSTILTCTVHTRRAGQAESS